MFCRPASQFCCGCSLEFGVKFILAFNLARNLLCIAAAVAVVEFRLSGYVYLGGGGGSIGQLLALTGFALAGVPIILFAIWGVTQKLEAPLRLYLLYMVLGFVIDEALVGWGLFVSGPCGGLATHPGEALVCGAARGLSLGTVATVTSLEAYLIFVVMSYCQDLGSAGGGPALSDLTRVAFEQKQARVLQAYLGTAEAGDGGVGGYGTCRAGGPGGLGGSEKIFGQRHELAYPPPSLGLYQ